MMQQEQAETISLSQAAFVLGACVGGLIGLYLVTPENPGFVIEMEWWLPPTAVLVTICGAMLGLLAGRRILGTATPSTPPV